jgi:hypothetical protein
MNESNDTLKTLHKLKQLICSDDPTFDNDQDIVHLIKSIYNTQSTQQSTQQSSQQSSQQPTSPEENVSILLRSLEEAFTHSPGDFVHTKGEQDGQQDGEQDEDNGEELLMVSTKSGVE